MICEISLPTSLNFYWVNVRWGRKEGLGSGNREQQAAENLIEFIFYGPGAAIAKDSKIADEGCKYS